MIMKRIVAVLAAGSLLLAAAGCSQLGLASAPDTTDNTGRTATFSNTDAQPTRLVSTGVTIEGGEQTQTEATGGTDPADYVTAPSSEVSAEASDDAEESAEPSTAGSTNTLELLNFSEEFMKPGSLDGIDPYNDKVVALTFDDGPHPTNTEKLLDVLKANDAVATFFMVGENAAEYPDIVKRVYEEGNEIGTHSWDHSKNDLKWSHEEVMDQITRCNDAIQEATGLRTIIDRPPEGAINEEVANAIGRAQILWDVDPNDWKPANRDVDIVYDNVINGGELHDGAIVLSHDIRETTVDAYDRIIKKLKDEGYKLVTVTQLMQIADLRGKDVTTRFNGAPSAASAQSDTED